MLLSAMGMDRTTTHYKHAHANVALYNLHCTYVYYVTMCKRKGLSPELRQEVGKKV